MILVSILTTETGGCSEAYSPLQGVVRMRLRSALKSACAARVVEDADPYEGMLRMRRGSALKSACAARVVEDADPYDVTIQNRT